MVTPLTVGTGAVLCTIFIHALALGAMVNFVRRETNQAGLACGAHTRIRTYGFDRVKVQRKGRMNNLSGGTAAPEIKGS
jgi:hypothetical protein